MKITQVCRSCRSENIEGKAWVRLNDITHVDFSPLEENAQEEDYWCGDCEQHCFPETEKLYEPGDEVRYTDPDTLVSEIYKVIECECEDSEDSVYLISNGFTELEVYQHELE